MKKNLSFSRVTKKKKFPLNFLIDKIDNESHLFLNFLNVSAAQNRVIRQSKGIIREITPDKKFF